MDSNSPQISIKFQARWFSVVIVIFAVVQQIWPGNVWMVLSTMFGGIWFFCYLWAKSLAEGLSITRTSQYGWNQVGDVFEERIYLENRSIFPAVWVSIEDHSTLFEYSISSGTGIGANSSRRWTKSTVCEKRGEYTLGPTIIRTGDIFGLYSVEISYSQSVSYVVAPPVVSLPAEIQISIGNNFHDRRSMRRQTEVSNVSVSTREFQPGDSMKRIHWLITAKEDVPHVRQHENIHAAKSCWIVLDLNGGESNGVGQDDSIELSVVIAVSLANKFLLKGLAVGLLASGGTTILLPPAKGTDQFRKVQKTLASIKYGTEPLEALFLRTWKYLGIDNNVVIITHSKQPNWLSDIQQIRRNNLRPAVFLVKAEEDEDYEINNLRHQLQRAGIKNHVISHDNISSTELAPGKQGVSTWQVTPLGRAVKVIEEDSSEGGS